MSFRAIRLRGFTRLLAFVASLGVAWLAGVALRPDRGVHTAPVEWPADVSGGVELAPSGRTDGARGTGPSRARSPVLRIFSDYECAACLALHQRLGPRLAELASAGRLRVIYHIAPLSSHWRAERAGEVVYCVPAERRAAAHARIFETRSGWMAVADPLASILGGIATGVETDEATRNCVLAGLGRTGVARDRALAAAIGVQAVPGIFLDGERIDFASWRALRRFVEQAVSP